MSLAGHHFLLNASRHKAEELLEVFGELYDKAYPVTAKPRELPSLDCDAARDGTVWADSDKDFPFHYRFRGSHWEYFALEGGSAGGRRWTTHTRLVTTAPTPRLSSEPPLPSPQRDRIKRTNPPH